MNDIVKAIIIATNYFLLFWLLLVTAGTMEGCSNTTTDDPDARFYIEDKQVAVLDADFYDVVDRKTGVHYLYVENSFGAGMSPMYGSDGKIIVEEEEE